MDLYENRAMVSTYPIHV